MSCPDEVRTYIPQMRVTHTYHAVSCGGYSTLPPEHMLTCSYAHTSCACSSGMIPQSESDSKSNDLNLLIRSDQRLTVRLAAMLRKQLVTAD